MLERFSAQAAFAAGAAAALLAAATMQNVEAQPYPSRTIKLIVPYAPGGAGDVIARIVSVQLGNDLGVPVVVENKPGAGGMIGAHAVASALPDGYTLLLGNTTEMVVSPYLVKTATYDTQRDFRPVALAGYLPQLLVANPAVKAATLSGVISGNGNLRYGTNTQGALILAGDNTYRGSTFIENTGTALIAAHMITAIRRPTSPIGK